MADRSILKKLPGLGLCAVAVAVSMLLAQVIPYASALLVAIVLGILVRNLVPASRWPEAVDPGLAFAAKPLLRLGVVCLGAQLAVGDILGLGAGTIVLVVVAVLGGFFAAVGLGRLMKLPTDLTILIASGFSICGAAAVAGADSAIPAKKEHTTAAVALVVVFGTLMIAVVPLSATGFGLSPEFVGLWTGASVHEVAQVVAIGGIVGGGALEIAVVVKLARVLMLAVVIAGLSLWQRRQPTVEGAPSGKRPPLVPLFVIGFIALVTLRSIGLIPGAALPWFSTAQSILLTAAMFALGAGVRVKQLAELGPKPAVHALLTTVVMSAIGIGGAAMIVS
ncbi:YeiH family protein [Parenemella sanctibonifatiensis]|nr:putative sulfate exporter family transporter [Parenemella sanctibonifatiensis]